VGGGIVPPANVERTAGRRGGADREETLPPHSQAVLDAHLMIVDPAPSIRRSAAAGPHRHPPSRETSMFTGSSG